MTEQELNFYKKQEEEAKNKLWKIACEYGAEAHGRKPYIYWEDVEKIVKENKHLFLEEEEEEDGSKFNLSFFLLQHLEGKVWIENHGQDNAVVETLKEVKEEISNTTLFLTDDKALFNLHQIENIINNKIAEITKKESEDKA